MYDILIYILSNRNPKLSGTVTETIYLKSSITIKHGTKLTFVALIASAALRTALVPFTPLILITWSTHRKSTHMTSHKQFSIFLISNLITTDTTCF